ncbi:uncharacterized protein C8A04DRAFT_33098 [Dichotomopilus funicola]|uniref:Cytochrome P450 n=1 Tax=Dichotomopilus funicola TaxID=1934379 RepID=A0AAN6ZIT3_9PEZI|nr:hypothetical protein C8A04DRAFT_33098 [Dichotomopilus funicola]
MWMHGQRKIACFTYIKTSSHEERLGLRATQNRRLKLAFGIDNSLTTDSLPVHLAFLKRARQLLRRDRDWTELFRVAEGFLVSERDNAITLAANDGGGRTSRLKLAQLVRCMVLSVVLFDSFGVDPARTPRDVLVTITEEINRQWLSSKQRPSEVTPSAELNKTIADLRIKSPFPDSKGALLSPEEVLGLLMPQYETLWRVVLLTFVSAYYHQLQTVNDTLQRTASVPGCLGNTSEEKEALKLAKEGLRLFPSNKHLYRTLPTRHTLFPPTTISADITTLHRHPIIWGIDSALFRPSRFDDLPHPPPGPPPQPTNNRTKQRRASASSSALTPLQRNAYIPFSIDPHKCPAASNAFGERMVVTLVVALGRALGDFRGQGWVAVRPPAAAAAAARPVGNQNGAGASESAARAGLDSWGLQPDQEQLDARDNSERMGVAWGLLGMVAPEWVFGRNIRRVWALPTGRDEMEEWVWEVKRGR